MILSHRITRVIAYLLSSILIMQSCVAYRAPNYKPDDAAKFEKEKIKIITRDGVKHKLDWIIVKDQEIISYDDASKVKLVREEIEAFMAIDPFREITLEEALVHDGTVLLQLKNHKIKESLYSYKFDVLEENGPELYGIDFNDVYSERIVIQQENIDKIYVQDIELSTGGTIAIVLGAGLVIGAIYGMIQMANTNWISFSN